MVMAAPAELEEVEEKKEAIQEEKGRLKLLYSQLSKDFDCKNIKEAKTKLKTLKKETEKLTEEKENSISFIKKTYLKDDD